MQLTTGVETPSCYYCGAHPHQGICPRVDRIEYHPDGTVKQVWLREQPAQVNLPLAGAPNEPPVGFEVGHTCGVDCPETVWGE